MKDIMRALHNGNKRLTKTLIMGQLKTNLSASKRNSLLKLYNTL